MSEVTLAKPSAKTDKPKSNYTAIVDTLCTLIAKHKIVNQAKDNLEKVIRVVTKLGEEEINTLEVDTSSGEVRALQNSIKADLLALYGKLETKLDRMQETQASTLTYAEIITKSAEDLQKRTEENAEKLDKVVSMADRLANSTEANQEALKAWPTLTTSN
jgi:methyl-accepting chemotaxis protein